MKFIQKIFVEGKERKSAEEIPRVIEEKVGSISEIDVLTCKRTKLVQLRDSFGDNTTELGKTTNELKRINRKYGKKQAIQLTIQSIEGEREKLKKERGQVDSKLKVINDAIEYLRETGVNICPVCGSDIKRKQILRKLKAQIAKHKAKTIKAIDGRMKFLEGQEITLEDVLSKLEEFEGKLDELRKARGRLIGETSKIAGKMLSEREVQGFLQRGIRKAHTRIKSLQRAYQTKERVLQEIERAIDRVKAIYDVLSTRERFNQLRRVMSGEAREMKKLDRKIKELNALKNQLDNGVCVIQTDLFGNEVKMIIYELLDTVPAAFLFPERKGPPPWSVELDKNWKPLQAPSAAAPDDGCVKLEMYVGGADD